MKIISAFVAAVSLGLADARIMSSSDAYYWQKEALGSTMWLFNKDGLQVYSNDGMELKNEVTGLNKTGFYEVQSDGHRYVWVANGVQVDVFDINTGDYAGYVPSCGNPAMELRYLPTRQEMWLRCARSSNDEAGKIDVFSTNSLSSNHAGVVFPGMSGSSANYGWGLEIHSTLGNSGYAAPYNKNYLYEIDLSNKTIIGNYSFPEEVHSTYDLTYSPTNKHIYGKARVCCSCGFEGADIECPNSRSTGLPTNETVTVKTGPTASTEPQRGACGGSCEGSSADTIGVFEFDTVSKAFAASHNGVANNGVTAMSSPDGKYIVLATRDGGETVRILKAGMNGVPATVAADIPVAFGGDEDAGKKTVGDVAFIEDENRNFMVIAGWGNNEVAVVDLDDDYRMVKIMLTDNTETTASGVRNVEWAVGSNYVWIDGPQVDEMYVVEIGSTIDSAKVSNVIEAKGGFVIHVDNYERAALAAMIKEKSGHMDDVQVDDIDDHSDHAHDDEPVSVPNMAPVTAPTISNTASAATRNMVDDKDDDSTQVVATSGLIVGSIALLSTMALTVSRFTGSSDGAPNQEQALAADVVTLGSKQAV